MIGLLKRAIFLVNPYARFVELDSLFIQTVNSYSELNY